VALLTCWWYIKHFITILVSHMKCTFHSKDVNPLCRPHNKHGY
jgi:hypothetical protein